MMKDRELREVETGHYFAPSEPDDVDLNEGSRDIKPLAPFVISGGKNTERYYFIHVNNLSSKFKFNVRPKYFGDESAYTEVFPNRIKEILSKNADAKIFCVFDMDAVIRQDLLAKHEAFIESLREEIASGQVTICDSMPSFEFWLLLHFVDYEGLLKNYGEISQVLAPHIKPYFEESTKGLKKLLKSEKYLQDGNWVRRLIDEGRIEQAVARAKACIERVMKEEEPQSYSNVYKAFETN